MPHDHDGFGGTGGAPRDHRPGTAPATGLRGGMGDGAHGRLADGEPTGSRVEDRGGLGEGLRGEPSPPRDRAEASPSDARDRDHAPGTEATAPREGPPRLHPAQRAHHPARSRGEARGPGTGHGAEHADDPGRIHGHEPVRAPDAPRAPGHAHPHGPGHNHGPGEHLHSHLPHADEAADLQILTAQFIDGFREARDKAAYLRIAGVPLEIAGDGPALKLVDVRLTTQWQVGTASPSFGSAELSYLPFPGPMIAERTDMALVYVSLREKRLVDLRDFLRSRDA